MVEILLRIVSATILGVVIGIIITTIDKQRIRRTIQTDRSKMTEVAPGHWVNLVEWEKTFGKPYETD